MATTIKFFSYSGHPNTVNKSLGDFKAIEGDLRQNFDMLHPYVILRTSLRPQYNYCYIPVLQRYYFVERISFEGNNTYKINLSVDVLKTYESDILSATGRVTESDTPNPYISTRETVFNRDPNFEKVNFSKTGLLNEEGSIIMLTLKGTQEN